MLFCEVYRRSLMATGPLVGRLRVVGDKVTGHVARELVAHGEQVRREAVNVVNCCLDMPALASIGGRNYLFVPKAAPTPPPLPSRK